MPQLEEGKSASLNDNYGDTVPSRPQEIPLPNQLHTVSSSKSHHVGHGAGSPGEGSHGLLWMFLVFSLDSHST